MNNYNVDIDNYTMEEIDSYLEILQELSDEQEVKETGKGTIRFKHED